jgi:hypothetical protein
VDREQQTKYIQGVFGWQQIIKQSKTTKVLRVTCKEFSSQPGLPFIYNILHTIASPDIL